MLSAIFETIKETIAWMNNNTVGLLMCIAAFWATRKSIGYFDKKQTEKEIALVEETYFVIIKSLDILDEVKDQSIIMDRKFLEEMKKNPKLYEVTFIDAINNGIKILDDNRKVFSDLYDYNIKIPLFLKEEQYKLPLLLTLNVYHHTKNLLNGMQSFLNTIKNGFYKDFPVQFQDMYRKFLLEDLDNCACELWECITPSDEQKKRFDEGDKNSNIEIRCIKGRNSKIITEVREKTIVYIDWLKKRVEKYKNKKG